MDKRSILFIGGDERQLYCATHLYRIGYEVSIIGFDTYPDVPTELMVFTNLKIAVILADVIILPTPCAIDSEIYAPFSEKPLKEDILLKYLDGEKLIFGGKYSVNFQKKLKEKNIRYYDFLKEEDITVQNAYLTAEGTVFKMMEMSKQALCGKRVLIIGFGRIAKNLCRLLGAYKMHIHILARKKSDLAWAKLMGCKGMQLHTFNSFDGYDYVINTVPVKLFKNTLFSTLDAPFIDLAGVDEYHHGDYVRLSAVPGKYVPESAGTVLGEYVHYVLSGVSDDE